VLLEEVLTIEEALARFQGSVLVQIAPEDEGLLAELRALVLKHRGKNAFYLQVVGADGKLRRVRAGHECRVAISEVVREVGRRPARPRALSGLRAERATAI
jgi:hypothetical protein